ncbi:MAG TPA: hypothetical protein VMU95_00710 [Trebonia sp.]|nr:hypothetical protein [Trebonia sp.]
MSSSSQDQTPSNTGTGTQSAAPPSDTGRQYVPRPTPQHDDATTRAPEGRAATRRPNGMATGFTIAAAVMLMLSGAWNFLEGLAALVGGGGAFFATLPTYVYNLSTSGWGWFHLGVGIAVFVAGAALFMDRVWARAIGVGLAAISALVNFITIPYLPVWSVVIMALDIIVIWALLTPRRRAAHA